MKIYEYPFEQLNRIVHDTSELVLDSPMWGGPGRFDIGSPWHAPATRGVTIRQTANGFLVVADLPGFDREDISIRFADGLLTIRATEKRETDEADGWHRHHRSVFEQVTIPGDATEDEITASYTNGVLEITIPVEDAADESAGVDIEVE